MNTHVHADHVTGSGILVNTLGCKSAISEVSGAKARMFLNENDQIQFGDQVRNSTRVGRYITLES